VTECKLSVPTQGLTVEYRQAECRRQHRFCLMAIAGDSHGYFSQVKTIHDKPAYVET